MLRPRYNGRQPRVRRPAKILWTRSFMPSTEPWRLWEKTLLLTSKNMQLNFIDKLSMKKMIIIIITASIFLMSCDTLLHLSGTVIDSSNKLPVDSVCIYIGSQKGNRIYTDSLGQFDITQMTFGGFLGYPGVKISLEKKGYKPLKKKYANWNGKPVVIHLSKE